MEISVVKFNHFNFFDYKKLAWKEYIELGSSHFKSKLSFLMKKDKNAIFRALEH